MSRRARMHVCGGFYYIVSQRSPEQPPFFEDAADHALFESVLAETLQKYGTKALAFCCLPRAIHLIVKVGTAPTSRVMQRLLSQYARRRRKKLGKAQESSPQSRYHAVLFDHEDLLRKLTHYVHWLPALEAEIGNPEGYERSSHRRYAKKATLPWVSISEVLNSYASHPRDARRLYLEHMASKPDPKDIECFESAAKCHAEVLGGQMFRCRLPQEFPVHRSRITLDQVVGAAAMYFGVEASDVRNGVRAKGLALVRAVIAWHAAARGIAKLEEVAERLNRSAPTLVQAIKRYNPRRPELFSADAFPNIVLLAPLVPIGGLSNRTNTDESSADRSQVPRRHEGTSVQRVAR